MVEKTEKVELEGEKTFVLKYPIKLKDSEITEIVVKEPTAGQIEYSETKGKGANSQSIQLLGQCSNVHPDIIKSLKASDYVPMVEYVNGFFVTDPATGES